jgi:hypothetical protein
VIHAQIITKALQHVLAFLLRVPVMAGLAQGRAESLAGRQPTDILPASGRLEHADHPAGEVERFLVLTETAQVPGDRVGGGKSDQVFLAQAAAAAVKGALVGLQRLREQAEQPVVDRDVVHDIQRPLVIHAKNNFKFIKNAEIQRQRLAELAPRA